jgi:tripartite-type tricarboxylate transporter receptor subunit TctC
MKSWTASVVSTLAAGAVTVLCMAGAAVAQDKSAFRPTRTVTIVVPYSPGGGYRCGRPTGCQGA